MSESAGLTLEQMVASFTRFGQAMETQNLSEMQAAVVPDFTWTIPGSNLLSGVTVGPDQAVERGRAIARFGLKAEFLSTTVTGPLSLEVVIRDVGSHNGRTLDLTSTDRATFSPDGRLVTLTNHVRDSGTVEQANAFFG